MDVRRASFCFLLLCLQVRSSSRAEEQHFYDYPGETVTITCVFSSPGTWRMFCRENCEGENVLIKTSEKEKKRKRYKTEYKSSKSNFRLDVSISDLTLSDSGLYTCGLGGSSSVSYHQFRLVVVDALLDGTKDRRLFKETGSSLTVACSFSDPGRKKLFCRGECDGDRILVQTDGVKGQMGRYRIESEKRSSEAVLYVSIKQLTWSDSGLYRCHLDIPNWPDPYVEFTLSVTDALVDGTKVQHIVKPAGSSLTVACSVSDPGRTKLFCRGGCDGDRILVQTDGVKGQMGRYRIESEKRSSETVLYVSIKQLTRSDSGLYRCQQGRVSRRSHGDFTVVVFEEVQPSSHQTSSPTTTLSFSFGAGSSQPPVSTDQPVLLQGTRTSGDVLLFVVLTLSFITIILFSAALLVFCKYRSAQRDPPVQTAAAAAAEPDGVYEDIREDEELRRPLPVDICTVYSCVSVSKPTVAGTNDSVIAAASSQKAADLLSDLSYANVTFSNQSLDLPTRSSDGSAAVHSPVQNASRDADEPLYSRPD
ncbi:polymeric immunoglobulin receptor [Nothobranchius furzeri]|uniref:LOC107391509-like protein n=2 Tax=Nothobranchius furzeri TaxID=105023 RepID=A0A9D2XXT9_NOTFU|nr:putative LOC107391509-like protein [Nothobranchius furzeri]